MLEQTRSKPAADVDPALEASDDSDDEDYDPSATAANARKVDADDRSDCSGSASGREDNFGDYDSGDEKTIGKSIARGKKRKGDDGVARQSTDTNGGLGTDGGLVKTRAQRAQDVQTSISTPAAASTSSSTAIDALWAAMNAPPAEATATAGAATSLTSTSAIKSGETSGGTSASAPETISISRTYEFAGEVHKEEKTVLKDSAEARDFLASTTSAGDESRNSKVSTSGGGGGKPPLRRVTKRKSILDASAGNGAAEKIKKINTLEKSRLEWSSFVDREGIDDDLKRGNKNGYLDKQAFLSATERARYDQWKAGQGK